MAELRSLTELSLKWPDTRTTQTDQQFLAIIVQMQHIVDRLLTIARSEQAGQAGATGESGPRVNGQDVQQSFAEKVSARQIRVEVTFAPGIELVIDPVLLRSILST